MPLRATSAATLVGTALLLAAAPAHAGSKVEVLAERLSSAEDFRVRTQAALALGASKSDQAVAPLCQGLGDANATVRAAAAAALGKLLRGGQDCLTARLEKEASASVKNAIRKALARLESGGEAEPALTASTRFYVSLGKTADRTQRDGDGIHELVLAAVKKAIAEAEGVVLAPASETAAQAKSRMAKVPSLKGFYLTYKVDPPTYDSKGLTVKVDVAIYTYPAKSLKATLPLKLTQPGVSSQDRDTEDDLLRDAAARAFAKFLARAGSID